MEGFAIVENPGEVDESIVIEFHGTSAALEACRKWKRINQHTTDKWVIMRRDWSGNLTTEY